jgi:hypothetical protein
VGSVGAEVFPYRRRVDGRPRYEGVGVTTLSHPLVVTCPPPPAGRRLGVHVGPHRERQIGVADRDRRALHVHDASWRNRRVQDPS